MLATSDSRDGNAVIGKKGTSVLDSGDIGEQSRQACTAPAEECQASAVHRGAAVTDLGRTCRCIVSVRLAREGGPSCNVDIKCCNYCILQLLPSTDEANAHSELLVGVGMWY